MADDKCTPSPSPKWTVLSLTEPEASTWIGTCWEFFDDESAAQARYEDLEGLKRCPTLRPFYGPHDGKHLGAGHDWIESMVAEQPLGQPSTSTRHCMRATPAGDLGPWCDRPKGHDGRHSWEPWGQPAEQATAERNEPSTFQGTAPPSSASTAYCPYCPHCHPRAEHAPMGSTDPPDHRTRVLSDTEYAALRPSDARTAVERPMTVREKQQALLNRGWISEGKGRWHHPGFDEDTIHSFEVAWDERDNTVEEPRSANPSPSDRLVDSLEKLSTQKLLDTISNALSSLQVESPRLANQAFDAFYELERRMANESDKPHGSNAQRNTWSGGILRTIQKNEELSAPIRLDEYGDPFRYADAYRAGIATCVQILDRAIEAHGNNVSPTSIRDEMRMLSNGQRRSR